MKINPIKPTKAMAVKSAMIVVVAAFAIYGSIQFYHASVRWFNHKAVEYVVNNNLLSPEQTEPIIKEVFVTTGSVEDISSKVGEQVDSSIKANLK